MEPDNYITIANAVLLRKEAGRPLSKQTILLRAKQGKIKSTVRYGRRLVDKDALMTYQGKWGNPNPTGRPKGVKDTQPRQPSRRENRRRPA